MDPALLEPDVEYRVPIDVHGPRPALIEVRLRATESEEEEAAGFTVRCPACGRTFDRKTDDLTLRAHKTPDGGACPERSGERP